MITITEKVFGVHEGKPVTEYTLENTTGMSVSVINYGAIVTKIVTADSFGTYSNVVVGFDDLGSYVQYGHQYHGSIVGRYCNRIANGAFTLDGKTYNLARNSNGHHLHGGLKGFDKKLWQAEKSRSTNGLILSYVSPDGEEGYDGNLSLIVTYTLDNENGCIIEYKAETDAPTPVNLTNHCYFNLCGDIFRPINDHTLELAATTYTQITPDLIPTGTISPVAGTPLDFTFPKKIGTDVRSAGGYDHNFVLNPERTFAAILYEQQSGRVMTMYTTEPGIQFYSGSLTPDPREKQGLCLEAQHYPDSPNHEQFPTTILQPGEIYEQKTIYQFSSRKI